MWVINYEFGVKAELGLEEMEMEMEMESPLLHRAN